MTASPSHLEREIRRFLKAAFPLGEDVDGLPGDASLLEAGVLDSTGVLELIGFVESEFHIDVPDEDLVPENFDSVDNVVRYLGDRIAGADTRSA